MKITTEETIYAAIVRTSSEWVEGGTRLFINTNRDELERVLIEHLGYFLSGDDEEDKKYYGVTHKTSIEISKDTKRDILHHIDSQTVEKFEVDEDGKPKFKELNDSNGDIFSDNFTFDIIFEENKLTSNNYSYESIVQTSLNYVHELESKYNSKFCLYDEQAAFSETYYNVLGTDDYVFWKYDSLPLYREEEDEDIYYG